MGTNHDSPAMSVRRGTGPALGRSQSAVSHTQLHSTAQRSVAIPAVVRWVAVVFMLSTIFDGMDWSGLVGEGNTLSTIIGMAMVLAFLGSRGPRMHLKGATDWLFLTFAVACAFTEVVRFSTLPFVEAWPSLQAYFTTLQTAVMFLIFRDLATDARVRKALVMSYVVAYSGISLLANATWTLRGGGLARMTVLEKNENELAFTLGLALLCVVWDALGTTRWTTRKQVVTALLIGSMLLSIVRTGSRGGSLGTLAGLLVVATVSFRVRRMPVFVAVLSFLAWFAVTEVSSSLLGERFAAAIEGTNRGSRPELAEASFSLAATSPVIGVGPTYDRVLGWDIGIKTRISAHSTYLQVLLAYGLAGLIPFLLFLFTVGRRAWARRRTREGALAVGALASLVVFFVSTNGMNGKIGWVLIALAISAGAGTPRLMSTIECAASGKTLRPILQSHLVARQPIRIRPGLRTDKPRFRHTSDWRGGAG